MRKLSKKKISFTLFTLFGGIGTIAVCIYSSTYFIKIDLNQKPYSQVIYDIHSEEIGEIIKDGIYRHRKVDIYTIPEFTKKALITLEDKNFFHHSGIDIVGVLRAIWKNAQAGQTVQGASTLDSQLIRNIFWLNSERSFYTKLKEFYYARCINHQYSKQQILEAYLSNIYFGHLNYGITSASKYYFGKDIQNLTYAEQAALLVLPKNPTKYDPFDKAGEFGKRFSLVVKTLGENKIITPEEEKQILSEKLLWKTDHTDTLPYVVDFFEKIYPADTQGEVHTTIDKDMSLKIDEIAKQSILPLAWKNVSDYSIIVVNRHTQATNVLIGGKNFSDKKDGQVSGILAQRQAGSTIKPFTYVLAFQNLGYTPSTKVIDTPIQFETSEGYAYSPKNYSLDYSGEVTIAEALSQSINIPAVKTTQEVGEGNLYEFLKKVGITSLDKNPEHYGLALTLGVGEVSLYELTRAYNIFAHQGNFCKFRFLDDEKTECKKVVEKKYSDMIELILTNRYFKLGGFPIHSNLDFEDREVFVKTGTSRNFRDNWSIGYTKNYIIGVWVGNKDGSPMKGVSGASGAGEIFRNIVYFVEKDASSPKVIPLEQQQVPYLEIQSPLDGSIFKIDPSKPLVAQAFGLSYMTNIAFSKVVWKVDGTPYVLENVPLKSGVHTIEVLLYDAQGKIIATKKSSITVRKEDI